MGLRFKNRSFTPCVQVHLRFDHEEYPELLSEMLRFIIDEELFGIGSSMSGPGMYTAYHLPEDAKKIEKFVDKHVNKVLGV